MAFVALTTGETDAKSPLDDNLLGKIRDNLDDLNARTLLARNFAYDFKVNGPLSGLTPSYGMFKRLDGSPMFGVQTITTVRATLEVPGSTGTLSVDIRKYRQVGIPVTSLTRKFTATLSSVDRAVSALSTQSVSYATPAINTQSITPWKAGLSVASIILLGSNLVRYNFTTAPDSDYKVGDSITFASCTTGANNGTFAIVRVNDDGHPCVIVTNASGVAQTGAAGTGTLAAWAYNFTNPVNAHFTAGELAIFSSHTNANNNGDQTIYAINSGGNNIIVKNALGAAQATATGNALCRRGSYNYSSAVPSDYAVGEYAIFTSQNASSDNGTFLIKAVNSGGNNIIAYNDSFFGVGTSGSVGGVSNTTRFTYSLGSDPAGYFSVGDSFTASGNLGSANNGTFTVVQVKRSGLNNLVVSNINGINASTGGTLSHSHMLVTFSADQSAIFTTASNIEFAGLINPANMGYFDVLAVNYGGGSNYNVVINSPNGVAQAGAAGRVTLESKSIFAVKPSFSFPSTGESIYNNKMMTTVLRSGADLNAQATISSSDIANGVFIGLDIVSIPTGAASDLIVQIL